MNAILAYAFSFVGTPYRWNGNNPMEGLDCSAYVGEILRGAGVINKDMSAQQLYDHLLVHGYSSTVSLGAIAFFGKSDEEVSHVAFCVNKDLMLEAAGGDSTTLTREDAVRQNAFVKMNPITRRRDLISVIMPSYRLSCLGG